MRSFAFAGLCLLLCLASALPAGAATFCVADVAALQNAVNVAESNDQDNDILLVKGTYALDGNLLYNSPTSRSIAFRGGYAPGCNVLGRFLAPANTVIDGQSVAGRRVTLVATRTLTVEGLSFTHFNSGANSTVYLDGVGPDAYIEFRDDIVQANTSATAAVLLTAPGGALVTNNLVTGNTAPSAIVSTGDYPARRLIYSFNTVAGNSGDGLSSNVAWFSTAMVLASNIFWNNGGKDLHFNAKQPFALDNIIGTQQPAAAFAGGSAGNLGVDPKLDANFRLTAASTAAINTGFAWAVATPALDIDGGNRTIGSAPDRGAFESANNDVGAAHTYTVTSTSDGAGAGTLREAITAANAAGVPALIKFDVGCGPAVIQLGSVLPDIKVPLKIDGYSQSGAGRNTLKSGFNGKLCVALLRGGSTSYAFRVAAASPSARLDVSGLIFSFFPGAAVALADGSGHWIHGNSFGVSVPANGAYPGSGAVFGNGVSVLTGGAAFASVVGGLLPGDRNLIGNGSGPVGIGVNLGLQASYNGLHTVQNNYIGTAASGVGPSGNSGGGIAIFASDYDEVSDNLIAANGGPGLSIGGTPANNLLYALVHRNLIGEGLDRAGMGNATAGVLIDSVAANNVIGASSTYGGSMLNANTIGSNLGPGIWVDETAGHSNLVALNHFDGDAGLAIDLGALGPLANDAGDADDGPDTALNTPALVSASLLGPRKIALAATFAGQANGYYTLHFFYSAACGGSGVGPGEVYLGSVYQPSPSGSFDAALTVDTPDLSPLEGGAITAVATDIGGNTSEFSACLALDRDYLFQDGFEVVAP